jgi:hypothetical protein
MRTMQNTAMDDVLAEDLSVEQLERVSGGGFGLDLLGKVALKAAWQGVKFAASAGADAGRGDR